MSDENVIPFRKRLLSEAELDVYRRITRGWSSELKQLLFPEHFRLELEDQRPIAAAEAKK